MSRSSRNNRAAAPVAAATETPSTSASASAALADREGGTGDAASSDGAPDQLAAGEGGDALAGGDATTSASDHVAGPDGAPAFAQTVGDTAIRLAGTLTALSDASQPSPSSAPQVSDLASAETIRGAADFVIVGERLDVDLAEVIVTAFEASSILPAVIQLPLDVTITLGELVVHIAKELRLDVEAWNGMDPAQREDTLRWGLERLAYGIQTPWHSDDAVIVEAVSADDQPYRRCGVLWASQPQEVEVHPLVAARLKSDPFILVKAERLASED